MKKVIIISLFLFVGTFAFGGLVPAKDAAIAAKSHYFQSINSAKQAKGNTNLTKWEDINLTLYTPLEKDAQLNYYAFNVNENNGFVIVSSESRIRPILAYSFEGEFDYNKISPAQKDFFSYYSYCIEYAAATEELEVTEEVMSQWQQLMEFDPYTKSYGAKSTSPLLLEGINWNQTQPYNSHCPEDPNSNFGGRVPVGCVATSMCQVMKYYNWPPSGSGSKNHPNNKNGGYGNITVNFAQQTYDWTAILDTPNRESEELGKINFHTGVAVDMSWGADGSGSYTDLVPGAFKNYLRYSSSVKMLSKSSYGGGNNYTDSEWISIIKEQIDAKRPIIYAGSSTTVGHAWNCDGYQDDDMLHMNWGWGGSGNCYCTINELISSATAGGSEDNFNRNQRIVVDIIPETSSYPEFCTGSKRITGNEGTFDDGSSIEQYKANTSCVYTIAPDCGTSVSIEFIKFDLASGDNVYIYDGDENSDVILKTFNADNIPSGAITSNNGALTIRFNTNGTSRADGWKVKYSVKTCADNLSEQTEISGTIEDGSRDCNYVAGRCSWKICPPDASAITISFDEFDLIGNDEIRIFKKTTASSNLEYTFKANNIPTGEYKIDSDTIIIRFQPTINTVGAQGWKLKYKSTTLNTDEIDMLTGLSIIPNPGNENSKLALNLPKDSKVNISIINVLGKIIATKNVNLSIGYNELLIREIAAGLANGVYYVNVQVEGKVETIKFIVSE